MDAPPRKLTVLDGMILVAACAVGIAGARALRAPETMPQGWWRVANDGATWGCLVGSLVLIPIRLRRPRPRRLWRQPGWLACASVAIALAVNLFWQILYAAARFIHRPSTTMTDLFGDLILVVVSYRAAFHCTTAVASVWTVLALSRRWKAEPSAIDRLGRGFGAFWLAYPLLVFAGSFI